MKKFTIKFTKEEIGRILDAHVTGKLEKDGKYWLFGTNYWLFGTRCCINQAAYLIPSPIDAFRKNTVAAIWFDSKYNEDWSVQKFLNEMQKKGLV